MQNVQLLLSIFVGLMCICAAYMTVKNTKVGDRLLGKFLTTVLMLFLASCFFTGAILSAIDILTLKLK